MHAWIGLVAFAWTARRDACILKPPFEAETEDRGVGSSTLALTHEMRLQIALEGDVSGYRFALFSWLGLFEGGGGAEEG
jgi:hypothetical protein